MNCKHLNFVITEHETKVCVDCGCEQAILINNSSYSAHMRSAPLCRLYSRPDRWVTLLKKIVGLHSGPPVEDPAWTWLRENGPFNSVEHLRKSLRGSRLSNKHYPNIHSFAKVFVTGYRQPSPKPEVVLNKMKNYFDFILKLHHRSNMKNFFSYNWLVEQALHLFNFTEYLPFVKLLKCKSRRANYTKQLIGLFKSNEIRVESESCEHAASHPLNERFQQGIRHSQLQWRQRPSKAMHALARRGHIRLQTLSVERRDQTNRLLQSLGMELMI